MHEREAFYLLHTINAHTNLRLLPIPHISRLLIQELRGDVVGNPPIPRVHLLDGLLGAVVLLFLGLHLNSLDVVLQLVLHTVAEALRNTAFVHKRKKPGFPSFLA